MGLWDVIRGRSATRGPNLDNLFAIPGAAITLQTSLGMNPTGIGSVCFRAAAGAAMAGVEADAVALIETDGGPKVEHSEDGFGFSWLVVRAEPTDVSGLVTDLHAVNTGLETQGFGSGLLCSVVGFADTDGRRVGLVYLYKQGTFYPFSPSGEKARNSMFERQVRDAIGSDLPFEPDPGRWLALWGAPGL
ncbi:PspA-associated protein PspAB [Nocardioides terrisoli]|uniref:PspA-associated protein PspAB n=1 Tax=Nocardioides terrisoli TaxID=3388267 RepID=UPI00287B969C|nr:hypothetical protein [Nocardioides marmorisolisilvae]